MKTNTLVHDVFCCKQVHNMAKGIQNGTADHTKPKVILGQGQVRPVVHVSSDVGGQSQDSILTDGPLGRETPKNGKNEVISGQGHGQSAKVHSRVFYNKSHTPSNIESLLVRPLCQNVTIFRANAHRIRAKSYADTKVIEPKSVKHCKGGVFWASKRNTENPQKANSLKLNITESSKGVDTIVDKSVLRDYQSNIESINECHTQSQTS